MSEQRVVFISCGQYAENERKLGREIIRLVEELTPFRPYFADQVSDLDGLTRHIFSRLNEAVGLITVMHHRGKIQTATGPIVRGSVWIEQEIAIAAFIRQALNRELLVAPFAQRGITLEGVRQQLILNPYEFTADDEVLQQLREILPQWSVAVPAVTVEGRVQPAIEVKPGVQGKKSIEAWISNEGKAALREFRAEILVPKGLVPPGMSFGKQANDLSTEAQVGILMTERDFPLGGSLPLYPGKRLRLFASEFEMGESAWLRRNEIGDQQFEVRLYLPGEGEPVETAISVGKLGLDEFAPPAPIEVMEATDIRDAVVRKFVDSALGAGQSLKWRYESEISAVKHDGHPYCFVAGRRVLTHANRNRGDRARPPEYLVFA